MDPEEIEAVGMLKGYNPKAWDIYIGYITKLLNFERDQCVIVGKDKVQIHQGRARAFREVVDIGLKAEKIYYNQRGGK